MAPDTDTAVAREAVLQQLERILESAAFAGAERSRSLLSFVVQHALRGTPERLKEYTLGAEALGKGEDFDPRTDPIVRAEASRLRSRLDRYYASEGRSDSVLITLPRGTYVPQFQAREIAAAEPQASSLPLTVAPRSRSGWIAAGLAIAAIAAAAIAFAVWRSSTSSPTPAAPARMEVQLTRGDTWLASEVGTDVVLSADGSRLVLLVRGADGRTRLMARALDQSTPVELPGTEGARSPFLSPDGRWVGFWAAGAIKKVSLDGGAPVVLCSANDLLGASWGDDGQIVAAIESGKLSRIPSSPGTPTVLADFTGEHLEPRWPQLLPGGTHVLFTAVGPAGPNGATIEALSLSDGRRTVLARGGTFGRYLEGGYLTYVNQGTLFALPIDVARMATTGAPVAVLTDVAYSATFGFAQMDVARNGTLLYRRAPRLLTAALLDASGRQEPVLKTSGEYTFPRLSPDGRHLAFNLVESGMRSTVLFDRERERPVQLTTSETTYSPVWHPGGRFVVVGGPRGLRWADAEKPDATAPLVAGDAVAIPWSFTSDGSRLAYHVLSQSTGFDIWTVPVQASAEGLTAGTPEVFLESREYETYPAFSPDGRWLAYNAGEFGRVDAYVRRFPDDGSAPVRISTGGGRIPRWLPGGRELLYRRDDQRLMAVACDVKNGTFVAGQAREWSSSQLADVGVLANFDVHPDGRVIALFPARPAEDQQDRGHATFVTNFAEEIRRRVGRIQ